MKQLWRIKVVLVAVASLGLILPSPAVEAAVTANRPQLDSLERPAVATDVALGRGGVLFGQVVDAAGKPLPAQPVALYCGQSRVATARTDASGRFRVGGLRGAMYEVAAARSSAIYRLWAPNTAPPSARSGVLLVAGGDTVRGQQGPIGYWLGNPCVLAAVVAAAVSIPVAIHNRRIRRVTSP